MEQPAFLFSQTVIFVTTAWFELKERENLPFSRTCLSSELAVLENVVKRENLPFSRTFLSSELAVLENVGDVQTDSASWHKDDCICPFCKYKLPVLQSTRNGTMSTQVLVRHISLQAPSKVVHT